MPHRVVFHCNYVARTVSEIFSVQGLRSFKVIENGTIRKLGYSFLFAFHSNYGSSLYLAIISELKRNIGRKYTPSRRNIAIPLVWKNYDGLHGYPTVKRVRTSRICLAVSIEHRNVTERQTNGRTDGQSCYINIARQCADAR